MTEPRGFAPMLAGLEDGQLHSDLSQEVHDLMAKVGRQSEALGKAKGKLALTLTFDGDKFGVITIDAKIKVTPPEPMRQRSTRWLDPQGRLVSENPKQQKLPLRDVGARGALGAAREVADDRETRTV